MSHLYLGHTGVCMGTTWVDGYGTAFWFSSSESDSRELVRDS